MRPPVSARFVLPLGSLARFSFWPLAFVGARALTVSHPKLLAALLLVSSLIASSVSSRAHRRSVLGGALAAGGAVAALAAFGAVRIALFALRAQPAVVWIGSLACALIAGALFARTLADSREVEDAPLDARALALLPVALWMAFAAMATRYGAEAVHFHVLIPTITRVMAALAALVAAVATFTFVRQRAWTERAYRDGAVVSPEGESVPRLSDVEKSDAVVAAPSLKGEPYRAHDHAIARVPATPELLLNLYARQTRFAAFALIGGIAALALVSGKHASAADSVVTAPIPATLPPLPGRCAARDPIIRLVALAPLHLMNVEDIAERYRRAGLRDVRVEAPLPFDERFLDPTRSQLVGEELVKVARQSHAPRTSREHVIVITDLDMYLRDVPWRYAFAVGEANLSVISLARMDSSFAWLAPNGHALRVPECGATLRARAFKMITRSILRTACQAQPVDDPRSVLRHSVLSLDDLDVIDETFY